MNKKKKVYSYELAGLSALFAGSTPTPMNGPHRPHYHNQPPLHGG